MDMLLNLFVQLLNYANLTLVNPLHFQLGLTTKYRSVRSEVNITCDSMWFINEGLQLSWLHFCFYLCKYSMFRLR